MSEAHRVCPVAELPDPGVREFEAGEGDRPFRGLVVQVEGRVFAYANVCPHKQHALNGVDDGLWVPGQRLLRCSSHEALFDPESGLCLVGPCAGRALTPLPCGVEAGMVWVRLPGGGA